MKEHVTSGFHRRVNCDLNNLLTPISSSPSPSQSMLMWITIIISAQILIGLLYVLVSMGSNEVDYSSVVVSFLLPEQAGLGDEAHD